MKKTTLKEEIHDCIKFTNAYTKEKVDYLNNLYQEYIVPTFNDANFIEDYNMLINKIAKLFHELKINDPIRTTLIYEYLLWNGYFSINKTFQFSFKDRKNHYAALGADVIQGKSVCLNNADMLNTLLKKLGYESYLIFNFVMENEKYKLDYSPQIIETIKEEKKSFNFNFLLYLIKKRLGNHACTLVKINDSFYICDPTKLAFFNFYSFLKAKSFCGNIYMDIKPWSLALFENRNIDQLYEICGSCNKPTAPLFDDKKIFSISETTISFCKENRHIFDDFYDDCKKDIENINIKLLKK